MRILQIGAGSMGTRRLRDLSPRPDVTLAVFDRRADRRERAKQRFSVPTFGDIKSAMGWEPQAIVISTPPDQHDGYIELALENGLHHFCEAHIWTYDYRRIEAQSKEKQLVSASSCTMRFLPVIGKLKEIVDNDLGDLQAYQMMLSTWLPTWHPGEGTEFYARNRHTAAAREMVPFELLYLNDIFGPAARVAGSVGRRGQLEAASEDTWCLQMDLQNGGYGQLTVMMGSPVSARRGCCFGSNTAIRYDVLSGRIVLSAGERPEQCIECGALKDVVDGVYEREINTFIEAAMQQIQWPFTYHASSIATGTLAAAETSAISGQWEKVNPLVQPDRVPGDARCENGKIT